MVYATGANTFFGRAAALISGVHNVANIQKARAHACHLCQPWRSAACSTDLHMRRMGLCTRCGDSSRPWAARC